MKKKVGILGGAFDPVHLGHLHLARLAIKKFDFETFVFLPSFTHPFKGSKHYFFSFEQRVQLLQETIDDFFSDHEKKIIEISPIEKNLSDENFTIQTTKALLKINPSWDIHFIIGSDNLSQLHEWHQITELLKICHLVSFQRQGYNNQELLTTLKNHFDQNTAESLIDGIFEANLPNVSSSSIREKIKKNIYDSKDLLPITQNAIKKIISSN